jgi:Predicted membrane protein
MNRDDYIEILSDRLKGLPQNEIDEAIRYVQEYFDEAGEENFHQAMDELGSPYRFANQIKADVVTKREYSRSNHKNVGEKKSNSSTLWIILLGILSLPLSLPLVATVFGLLMALFGILFAFLVSGGALLFAGIVVLVYSISKLFILPLAGVSALAVALMIIGLGLIMISFFTWLLKKAAPSAISALGNVFQWIKEKVS